MFFIKTPLLLLSGGTSATLTEFAVDQLSGVLLDKLQEDGAINMETNMLASVIIGMVGSRSFDTDQLKKLIEDVKRLSKKAKQEDVKRLIAEIVEKWKVGAKKEVAEVGSLANQIDNTLSRLTGKAKYALNNTGEYKVVAGHHPMAKKAFEGDIAYDYQKAFSIKTSALDDAWKTANSGIPQNLHAKITGQQNSLYTVWKQANPNTRLTIDAMADIEIQVMKNVGIPEDVATGWVVKALEDLKAKGVTEIKNIPWNGVN